MSSERPVILLHAAHDTCRARQQPGQVARAVPMTGCASLVRVVNTSSPSAPSGSTSPLIGIDDLGIEMVFPDMRTVLGLDAFARHAWSDHFGQAVDVDRIDAQARLDLLAHFVGPGFGTEQAYAQTGAARLDVLARQFVGDGQRIRWRGQQHGGLEVQDHLHLLLGLAARHRNHSRAETFAAVMRAEPAGEQAVAIRIEDDVVGGCAGRAQRARHHGRPHGDIALGIADHRRLAGGAGRSMHAERSRASVRRTSRRDSSRAGRLWW